MEQYLIIGNGVAAAAAVEGIRSVDAEGSITVISAEKHPVYCRPLISYYLEGRTDTTKMAYRAPDFYEKNKAEVLWGRRAAALDADGKTVTLDDGTTLAYTKVCVAAGSSPFVPPFAGLDSVEKAHAFMTLDDALGLEAAVTPASRVFIVGAGLIGLKCAEGLFERAASVTVCDLAPRILSSILDDEGGEMVKAHLEAEGVSFLLGDSVAAFEGKTAHMKSGVDVDFDVLVLAVGVRANTSLVKDAGGAVDRGILVDASMRTSLSDVFAAGDCTQGDDVSFGAKRVLALMPNAYMQGFTAGVSMAGGEKTFDNPIPMNSIGLLGVHVMTAGTYAGDVYAEKTENSLKKLFVKDGYLVGFILINDTARAGIYTSMIRNRVPVSGVNFEILKKTPTSAAFSEETRRKMFGGVV